MVCAAAGTIKLVGATSGELSLVGTSNFGAITAASIALHGTTATNCLNYPSAINLSIYAPGSSAQTAWDTTKATITYASTTVKAKATWASGATATTSTALFDNATVAAQFTTLVGYAALTTLDATTSSVHFWSANFKNAITGTSVTADLVANTGHAWSSPAGVGGTLTVTTVEATDTMKNCGTVKLAGGSAVFTAAAKYTLKGTVTASAANSKVTVGIGKAAASAATATTNLASAMSSAIDTATTASLAWSTELTIGSTGIALTDTTYVLFCIDKTATGTPNFVLAITEIYCSGTVADATEGSSSSAAYLASGVLALLAFFN